MTKFKNAWFRSALSAVGLIAGSVAFSTGVAAQQRMPVPSDGTTSVEGCWRGVDRLYGEYRFEFCLNQWTNGRYNVEGRGLACEGDLNWSRSGRSLSIRLRPTRCDRRTDWSPDVINCTLVRAYSERPVIRAQASGPEMRMPVPGGGNRPPAPTFGPPAERLSCDYVPMGGGYRMTRIEFQRERGQWAGGTGGRWEELGCERVSGLIDRHVIRVGREQGRYRAVKLAVRENNVNLMKMKVTYGNGRTEELPVRSTLLAGTETNPIELSGGNRGLREIEMVLLRFLGGRKATVCAYGLQ